MKNACDTSYLHNMLSTLMGAREKYDFDRVLSFALANKLLSACVSSGLLNDHNGVHILDRQKWTRAKAIEMLTNIHRIFSVDDIRYAVMKGFAFERAIYGDLWMRDVGDIDIIVKADDISRAHKQLCQMGYQQQLGSSSGSIASLGRARFAAHIMQQQHATLEVPLRRFPHKDAYCPYVKLGYPTVELHDGFRGLPNWYTDEVIERAYKNEWSLIEDKLDTIVFLLVNTYENAESFYSNCFDDKIVLRDFVDLACCFRSLRGWFDWGVLDELINKLGIKKKVGRVLHDLDCFLPGESDGCCPEISRLESLWNMSIIDRAANTMLRKRSVYQVVRNDIKFLARKERSGLSDTARSDFPLIVSYSSSSVAYSLFKADDDVVVLSVGGNIARRDGTSLLAFCFFPIVCIDPPLCRKIIVFLGQGLPVAYLRDSNRLLDGFTVWTPAGLGLEAYYDEKGEVVVRIPCEVASVLLREGQTAISAGVYDRKYSNVFWARCRGKAVLTDSVPIGHLSLYSGLGIESIVVEFAFARCSITSDDASLLALLVTVFDEAVVGSPVDSDDKLVRGYAVMREAFGSYAVEAAGEIIGRSLSREKASSLLMQAIADWVMSAFVNKFALAHASSNLVGDAAVLCMGASGSGKTSLALALAKYWPLRGDECACVDFDTGMTLTESFPVNVKADNGFVMGFVDGWKPLPCESTRYGGTFCFNRHIVRADSNPLEKVRIKAIVFPVYDKTICGFEIKKPNYDVFVPLILGSLVSSARPSGCFVEFMKMASACNIKLFSVRYSDAEAVATALVELIEGGKKRCDV